MEDYKEGYLMVWTNYMSPWNSIVGLYFNFSASKRKSYLVEINIVKENAFYGFLKILLSILFSGSGAAVLGNKHILDALHDFTSLTSTPKCAF